VLKGGRGRRARNKAARRWVLNQLINREGGSCQRCKEQVNLVADDPRRATVDHVVPRSKGGSDQLSNLALLCKTCNEEKDDAVPDAPDDYEGRSW
jgi:5-methylcytosine-specific restriction endonuclease McrA